MKGPTFKANCVICGKEQTYMGKKSEKRKGEVYLCSKECSLRYAEKRLELQKKNSVLPDWLFDKGVIDWFPNIHLRNSEIKMLNHMKRDLKKIKLKKDKKVTMLTMNYTKEVLKQPNMYYLADDVEKAFKEVIEK